jgi:hypothetical protein
MIWEGYKRVWQEVVVKTLPRHQPRWTEEEHRKATERIVTRTRFEPETSRTQNSIANHSVAIFCRSRFKTKIYSFIHFLLGSHLEHRAPFGVSVITHTKTHGRTPLYAWLVRRRGLYLHRTTQHINTRDKHPVPERDSNPRPQQPSGGRPTP